VKETRFYAQHKQLKKEQLKRDDVLHLKRRLLSAEKANDREEREIKNPRFSSKDDDAQFRTV
jgi:hypothetical protein